MKLEVEKYLNNASKHIFKVEKTDTLFKIFYNENKVKIVYFDYNGIIDSELIDLDKIKHYKRNQVCVLKHMIFKPYLKHTCINVFKKIRNTINLLDLEKGVV